VPCTLTNGKIPHENDKAVKRFHLVGLCDFWATSDDRISIKGPVFASATAAGSNTHSNDAVHLKIPVRNGHIIWLCRQTLRDGGTGELLACADEAI
jgi:hypothetical protein